MKKFITTILAVMMIVMAIPATAMAYQPSRCPLCGTENSFVYYSKEYGYCYKCHRTTDTVCLTVNIHSDPLSFEQPEIILYKNGKIERLASTYSGDQTILFSGLQKGLYTLCINMNGYMPITKTLNLFNKENAQSYNLRLRGDVNGDGIVSEIDYKMVRNHINGWPRLVAYQYQCADINGDWRVDSKDLDIIKLSVFD